MSKRENDANNAFRSSDSPLTEYEKEQIDVKEMFLQMRGEI